MCQPRNLRIKPQPGLTFFLGNLQLPLFVLSNIGHSNLAAESSKNGVFGRIDGLSESVDTGLQGRMGGCSLQRAAIRLACRLSNSEWRK